LAAAAASAAHAAPRTVSSAQATAVANAIAIVRADLPAYSAKSNPITKQELAYDSQLTSCVHGIPVAQALANTQSANFAAPSGKSVTINSGTEILPSAALVSRDYAAITGRRGLPCLLAQVRDELVGTPPKGEKVTDYAYVRHSPVVGVASSFADRFVVTVSQTKGTTTLIVPIYVDLIGFAYGQAEVSLTEMAVGSSPPAAQERRLVGLLVTRARSQLG
jgi:hypothetical protein